MSSYIATFFSHFGAIRFQKQCEAWGYEAQVRPVPRDLSSSCGTCVFFATEAELPLEQLETPELEQVVRVEQGYMVLFKAAEE